MTSYPDPECQYGYSWHQLEDFLDPETLTRLREWMHGQTMALCIGDPQRKWVDDENAPGKMRLIEVGPPLCERAHGGVVYASDFRRFMAGLPVID